jgi:hypothetical protein
LYFKKINRNMTVWNAFMHNGVQLFVPDVQSIMTKMDEDGTPYMVRSSGESSEYTHVLFEVTGRVWELIGISNMNNDDGASGRTFGRAECPAAHEVRHPSAEVLYDAWDASGSFERPNGLMQPMLMRTTVSASEPQLAAAVYYESLHKVRRGRRRAQPPGGGWGGRAATVGRGERSVGKTRRHRRVAPTSAPMGGRPRHPRPGSPSPRAR